jgi:CO/xanthine dehydrogenase FAD-binding subunit
LNKIEQIGQSKQIGATVTLQQLYEFPGLPVSLKDVIKREANQNIRHQGTLAGTIVCSDGKSSLVAGLLALDLGLTWVPGDKKIGLGDWLSLRHNWNGGLLITGVELSLVPILKFACVSRAPLAQSIVCVAMGKWPSGRTRIVVGGWGPAPILVLDGPNADGAEYAVQNACSHLPSSNQNPYITEIAKILTSRLFKTCL